MATTKLFRDTNNSPVVTLGTNTEVTIDGLRMDYDQIFVAMRCYDDIEALDANLAAPSGLTFSVLGRIELDDGANYWRTLDNGSGVSSSLINDQDRLEPAGLGHADAVKIVFTGDWSGYFIRAMCVVSQ